MLIIFGENRIRQIYIAVDLLRMSGLFLTTLPKHITPINLRKNCATLRLFEVSKRFCQITHLHRVSTHARKHTCTHINCPCFGADHLRFKKLLALKLLRERTQP